MAVNLTSSNIIDKRFVIGSILLSGVAWYLSTGLSGNFWFLLWLAPVPVLLVALNKGFTTTAITAFSAYLIGRMSWFFYLLRVATLLPAITFTLMLPLIFVVIILLSRWCIIRINAWYSIFVFPVIFTAFEFLSAQTSPHGTAGNLAYTQMNCLPLIQIASVTGLWGITFIITLIPSAIALAIYYRKSKVRLRYILITSITLVTVVFIGGIVRMKTPVSRQSIKVGLVVLDERMHTNADKPDYQQEKKVTLAYASQIEKLAAKGARVILLPERAFGRDTTWGNSIKSIIGNVARQYHVFIIAGNTDVTTASERNSALIFNDQGVVLDDYYKRHLVPGLERQFKPGNLIGLFKFDGLHSGVAICKDLDFQETIRDYGRNGISVLFVPAWDFVVDDWLHSRMAILRSVENGFWQVRCARSGRLTINDPYGRVVSERSSANGKFSDLIGEVSINGCNTLYSRWGDWFGITTCVSVIIFVLLALASKNKILIK